MTFEILNARIREVLPTVTGPSWTKATVIVEHADAGITDTYSMQVFGDDRIREARELEGREVDLRFAVRSHEYNGRWYTDMRLLFVRPRDQRAQQAQAQAPLTPKDEDINKKGLVDDPDGDLPF